MPPWSWKSFRRALALPPPSQSNAAGESVSGRELELPHLEAVCSPECPEFDSEGCQRALSLLYSDVEATFLSAHSMTTPVSIDAVAHLPLPPAFLELDVPSPFHQDGEFDADLTFDGVYELDRVSNPFDGVYELDGVSNGFPRWKSTHHSTDDDDPDPWGRDHLYVHRDTSGHWRVNHCFEYGDAEPELYGMTFRLSCYRSGCRGYGTFRSSNLTSTAHFV